MHQKRITAGHLLAGAVILLMIAAAAVLREPEIIFPEIAALATGVFLTPRLLWKDTGPVKFVGLMTASAVFGILLTTVISMPVYLRVVLGCVFSMLCLTLFRSGLYPLISACILPAIQNIQSWIYPVSVACCALAIVLLRQLMGRWVGDDGFAAIATNTDYKSRKTLRPRLLGFGCILIYALLPCLSGRTLLIAPPLFVLFLELFTDDAKLADREWQMVLLGALCCTAGALSAFLLRGFPGDTLLAGLVITAVLFGLLNRFGMYLPPVAALSFLPLILPPERLPLYPVYTGITLAVMALFLRWKRSRCAGK